MLVGAFLTEFYAMVARWAEWATAMVDQWSADLNQATPDRAAVEEIVRRATWCGDTVTDT